MVWPFKNNNKNWEKWVNGPDSPFIYDKDEEELIFDSLFQLSLFLHQFHYMPLAPAVYKNGKFYMYVSKADLEDTGVMSLQQPPRPHPDFEKDYNLLKILCDSITHTGLSNIVVNSNGYITISPYFKWNPNFEELVYTLKGKPPVVVEDDHGIFKSAFTYVKMVCEFNRAYSEPEKISSNKILETLNVKS